MLETRYYGGPVSRDNFTATDGVTRCYAYFVSLGSGQNLGQTLPKAEDREAFREA